MANNRPYMCEGNAIFLPENYCDTCDQTLLSRIAELEEKISDLQTALAAANARIDGTEASITNLYTNIQTVIERTDSLTTDITELTARVTNIEDTMQQKIDEAVDSINIVAGSDNVTVDKDGRTWTITVVDTDNEQHVNVKADGTDLEFYNDTQKVHLKAESTSDETLTLSETNEKIHLKAEVENDTIKLFYNN